MPKKSDISRDEFEELLNWLDKDKEIASSRYESIRATLIRIFLARGCHLAEELADETIDRVARKASSLAASYEGEPALYFYGVAGKVFLEFSRKPQNSEIPELAAQNENANEGSNAYYECLDSCLEAIDCEQRKLILKYYQYEKQTKLEDRRRLANEFGLSANALRIRAVRIRTQLRKCISRCVRESA